MSRKKDIAKYIKQLKQLGWTIELRKNHYMAYPPDKTQSVVTISATPSDHNAYKNIVADCKRRDVRL